MTREPVGGPVCADELEATREALEELREEIREHLAAELGGDPADYHADKGRSEVAPDGGESVAWFGMVAWECVPHAEFWNSGSE